MAKILKNQSSPSVDISIKETGVTIPAAGQITIDPINYGYWATPETITELTPHLNSGDIVVNDGVQDLSAADAIRHLAYPDIAFNVRFLSNPERSNGFSSKTVQEAIEEAKTTTNSKLVDFEFSSAGNTSNKWLNVGHPSISSNNVPLIAQYSGKIIALGYSNNNDGSNTDLEIYVNGSLLYSWEIRNKRTAYKAYVAGLGNINQGDRISVFCRSVAGVNPSNISGEVILAVLDLADGDGGTSSGV